jgi:type I restriction enzyme, S subunit
MSMFPTGWQVEPLSEVCDEIVDCLNKTATVVDGPTPYKMIRTTNVKDGRVNLEETRFVDEVVYRKWTRRFKPRRGDVILTREAPLGEVGLLRSDEHVFLGQRTMAYRANPEKLDQRFLYYSLLGPTLQAQIRMYGAGSTVEHMRVPQAESLQIPFPGVSTQKKIAAILSAYDDLIANNQRRITLLERMAEDIYREWFVRLRFPGHENATIEKGVPRGWSVQKFRDVVQFYIGGGWGEEVQTATHSEPAYVVRGTDIPGLNNGGAQISSLRFHTPSNLKSRLMQKGDLVFEVSGGSKDQLLGRNLLVSERLLRAHDNRVICASFCKMLRFNPALVSPHAMKYFFKLYYETDLVGLYQVQSTGISNYQFEAFLNYQTVLLPPLDLQANFDAMVEPMLELKDDIALQTVVLRKTRDALLPRLISGKLAVDALDIRFPPGLASTV